MFIELFLLKHFMLALGTPWSPLPILNFIHKVEGRGIVPWSRTSSRAISVNLVLSFLEGNQFFQELDAISQ